MNRIFILLLSAALCFASLQNTQAATCQKAYRAVAFGRHDGSPGDRHIKYFGRWDFSDPSAYTSYWGGAYIRVNFTGTTVKIKVGNQSNFFAKIDGGPWTSYLNAKDTIDLTPTPLNPGMHSLIVAQGKDYDYIFNFRGLILDPGASTKKPVVSHRLIEYIGDSITTGYTDAQADVSDYAWVASEMLGAEHTQIAYPGVDLVSGYRKGNGVGMDVQYFKSQSCKFPDAAPWNFKTYTPNVVVINLGTNDNNNRVPDSVFEKTYVNFLAQIRAKFPKTEILVMRTFLGVKEIPTVEAVRARNAAGDDKVRYVNTTDWLLGRKSADYNDGLHPSIDGHIKVARLLAPIIQPFLR